MRTLEAIADEAVELSNAALPEGGRITKADLGPELSYLAYALGLKGWPDEPVPTDLDDLLMHHLTEAIARVLDVVIAEGRQ